MKIRIKRAWATYRVGDTIEPPASLRQLLLQTGFAEPIREEVQTSVRTAPETATIGVRTKKRTR
jgi:hypothetical protein